MDRHTTLLGKVEKELAALKEKDPQAYLLLLERLDAALTEAKDVLKESS